MENLTREDWLMIYDALDNALEAVLREYEKPGQDYADLACKYYVLNALRKLICKIGPNGKNVNPDPSPSIEEA